MTGRPGYRTMEMIGGSSAPYLARTLCVPLFCTSFNRVGNKERFRLPGAGGGSFPLYGGTFARSYSVSTREPPGCGKKWESEHVLKILENVEVLEILEISPAERPLS